MANSDDWQSLYQKLEAAMLSLNHNDRATWVRVMNGAICKIHRLLNSHRMIRRYVTDAYLH